MMHPLNFIYALTLFGMSNLRGGRLLLSLYALDLEASVFTVGVLSAVISLMPALIAWQVGKWTDRIGSRWPMMLGSLVSAAGMCVPFFSHTLAALFVAAVMNGIAFALYNVSQQNAVGMLSAPEQRTRNFANLSLMISLANFAGPLVAGFSIDHSGYAGACLYLASLGVLTAGLLQFGGRKLPKGRGGPAKAGGSLMELLGDRSLMKILMVGSLVFAAIDVFSFYVPVYTHGLGLSASATGIIISCFAAAAFISRVCLTWFLKHATVEQVLQRAFFMSAASFVLFPFVEAPVLLCALSFLYGFGLNVGQPITMMLSFNNSADGGRSGEVMGIRQSVNQVTRVIAPVVFGAIGSLAGLIPVFVAGSGMQAWGALMLRSVKLSKGADGQ